MRLISAAILSLLSITAFSQAQGGDNPDLKAAIKLSHSEQFEAAEQAFNSLLTSQPTNGDVYFYYGQFIINEYLADTFSNTVTETSERAEEMFRKGIKADSLNPFNFVGMGMVTLLSKSDTLDADKYFDKAESFIPRRKKNQSPRDAHELYLMGTAQTLGHVNRYAKANVYFEKAKAIDPMNASIYLNWGDVYLKQSDAQNAIANYNRALALDPSSPLPKIKVGELYMKVPNLRAALPLFEEARDIDSTFAPVYRAMGELYTLAGRYDLAKENYKKFLDLSGNNAPAKVRYAVSLFKSKDYAGAITQVEEVQTVDKSRNYLNRIAGYSCYEKRPPDLEKGKHFMEEFFANAKPDQIITRDYSYYGRILYRLAKGDSMELTKAFANLNKAYLMDTNDLVLLSEMASDYYYSKFYAKAIETYNKKIAKGNDREKIQDMMQIGKAYYILGEYGKCDTAMMNLTAIDPGNIQAYLYSSRAMASIEQQQMAGAYNVLETSIAQPKFQLLIDKIGTDTVKYNKELEEAYTYMGSLDVMFLKTPDYVGAINWFEKMRTLEPNNKSIQLRALKSMALVRYKEKKYKDARDLYIKVKQLDPNDPDLPKVLPQLEKAIKAQEAANNR